MKPLFLLDSRSFSGILYRWLVRTNYPRECGLNPEATTTSNRLRKVECETMRLKGYHHTEETKAKISAANMGHVASSEIRASMSASHMGHIVSAETRVRMSLASKGHLTSLEQRAKQSLATKGRPAWNKGVPFSSEARANMSVAHKGIPMSEASRAVLFSVETLAKNGAAHWKGGRKTSVRRDRAKRRLLGFAVLNEWFPGCEGHHVDNEQVIYMPKGLHQGVYHRQSDGRGMAKINAIAYNFLFKQEVEAAMLRVMS